MREPAEESIPLSSEGVEAFEEKPTDASETGTLDADSSAFGRFPLRLRTNGDAITSVISTLRSRFTLKWIISILERILLVLIPSFIQPLFRKHDDPRTERPYPTAYLDGLRGVAAFCVVLCHLSYTVFVITFAYGGPGENNNNLLQLPIIRLFYSGPPAVAIFFVISGYVLSKKPISQMRSQSFDDLLSTVSSSAFRRPFRLFLPCFASTFMVFCLVRMGAYEYTREFANSDELLRNKHEGHVERYDTFYEQLWHWTYQMFDFVHFWDYFIWGGTTIYDFHLWTIPVEFRASMILFLSHIMLARMRVAWRIGMFLGLISWALQWDRWEMILFWAGAVLAELDLIYAARKSSDAGSSQLIISTNIARRLDGKKLFWTANFLCALFLASYPDEGGSETPGYITLSYLIPQYYRAKYRFWQSIGAIQLVWTLNNATYLQAIFNGAVIQYLGKISYALYLMHGPVIHTFGWTIMPIIWRITGSDQPWRFELGFVISAIWIVLAIIWAADVFWRVVDIPCVRLARWIEKKCVVPSD